MAKKNESVSTDKIFYEYPCDPASIRAIAISAGDLSVVVRNEVKAILESNQNDIFRSLDAGLLELIKRNLILDQEYNSLKNICKHLLDALKGKEDGEEAFLTIRDIYHEILKNQNSSPTALAIASVANSAFDFEKTNSLKYFPSTTAAGAIAGAGLGATIGAIVGGGIGAGLGAAIGGAAGGAIGFCNETGT